MATEEENVKHITEIINFTQAELIGEVSTISPKDRDIIAIVNSGCNDILGSSDKQEVIDIAQCISRNLKSRIQTPQSSINIEKFLQAILATLEFFIDVELNAIQRQKTT